MLGQIYDMSYGSYHYVGKHDGDIFKDNYFGSGIAWSNVVKKHGKENIKRIILETYDTKEQANILEKKYIKEAKFAYGNNCLNIADGGQGGDLGPEVRARISAAVSGERNGMYGRRLCGEANGMYGKTHPNWNYSNWRPSEEMKQAQRERMLGDLNPCKREDVKEKLRIAAKKQINRSGGVKGGHWYTNGIESKCFLDGQQPDGWYRGRTIHKESAL